MSKIICTQRITHFTCQNATHLRNLRHRLIKSAIHTYVCTYHLLTRTFLRKPSSSLYCLAVRTQPPGSAITSGKVRAGNCNGTDNASSLRAGIPSVLPSLARNSSSQSNAEIKSESELTSCFQLKSAQPGADFYDLHLQWRIQEFFFWGGFNKFSWGQRTERTGIWGRSPLVRGSGGSCNLVQEISFLIVKFS